MTIGAFSKSLDKNTESSLYGKLSLFYRKKTKRGCCNFDIFHTCSLVRVRITAISLRPLSYEFKKGHEHQNHSNLIQQNRKCTQKIIIIIII